MARTKGEIFTEGGKQFISLGRGGARRVRARDLARVKIKRETASGKAPPIPTPTVGPNTRKELKAARVASAARKKKRAAAQVRPDAIQNEPTGRGIRKAFDEAAEGRKKAEEALQRKK
jgi:hypothetical protein